MNGHFIKYSILRQVKKLIDYYFKEIKILYKLYESYKFYELIYDHHLQK